MFKIYPAKGRITFDGGLNNKFERSLIEDNESPDCANVDFSNGSPETRQGFQKLNTASVGSFACDGLYTRRADTGAETMVAYYGGKMFTLAAATFTSVPSSVSLWTAGVRMATSQYENYLFMGNGYTTPYKWNGAELTRHGIYPPTTTSTVASQATGSLTGDFVYRVTTVNSALVESDVGPATATFTAASGTLRVTLPTFAASFGVAARRLYRATFPSSTAFARVAEISDNTTTSYDDNVTSLGAVAPTDNGVPPNYSAIIYHQNRLFFLLPNDNFLYYTDLANPYSVGATNFLRIGDASADIPKGLALYNNGLYVLCERTPWLVYMPDSDPANWQPVVTRAPFGSKSPFASLQVGNGILFPAVQNDKIVGFASLEGVNLNSSETFLTVGTVGADTVSNKIEPSVYQINESLLGQISGIVFKNKAFISVPYGLSQQTNNRIFVYDFSLGRAKRVPAWHPWTNVPAAQFTIYGGNLYLGTSDATGFVYKLYSGTYNDDGAAINSYLWSKEFSGESASDNVSTKDFRFADFLIENAGDWYMDLGFRLNSDTGGANITQVDLNPGGSLWGAMRWGMDLWGGGTQQKRYKFQLGGARAERIQFYFSNQNKVDQRFKVHALLGIHFNEVGYR